MTQKIFTILQFQREAAEREVSYETLQTWFKFYRTIKTQ